MNRRWEMRLYEQEPRLDEMGLESFMRKHQGPIIPMHDMYDQPSVTLEIKCNGAVVFAFHSPSKKGAFGEIYTLTLVDGRNPIEVLQEDMREHGLA